MKARFKNKVFVWMSFILFFIQLTNESFASHAQSADITYKCLGGNQYQILLSFYRDCAGVAAPNTVTINLSSVSCGHNFNTTLNQISGTGNEVTPICSQLATECSGGSYPGVQEYKYSGNITLPDQCIDWVFSFSLCCRNSAIGTIVNPSAENIYVEAHLDNLDFQCNSSPTFSNAPIPFVCVGQIYCFNNGSYDIDGDSLSYSLTTPLTSPTTSITYISPYSAQQPLTSSPAISFNSATGDMCMTPTQLQVTVFAILVEEWRNGILVGSVMRDVQLRTITCTNDNPFVNGINNTGQYSLTACAGTPINFTLSTFDINTSQNVSINWNNAINGATFVPSVGARPTAAFSWTPTIADISSSSHCFTVTVQDDNCPFNGSQTYSFCIAVSGIPLTVSSTTANCGASNGTAIVQVISGAGPFTYQWSPNGGNNAHATGLQTGTYTVNVSNSGGCVSTATTFIGSGAAPGNINMSSTNVSCFGGNNGTALANINGGQAPYTYLWSNGATTAAISGLSAGTYNLTTTTSNGCISSSTVNITQPPTSLSYTLSHTNITCNGIHDGNAAVAVGGGVAPYNYIWNTSPAQTSAAIGNLDVGNYSVSITDIAGCSISASALITQPSILAATSSTTSNVTCNGLSNGAAYVSVSGGTSPYTYHWNTFPISTTSSITGINSGSYTVTVTDANNCTVNSSTSITEPLSLSLTSSSAQITCNGDCNGQIAVIPTGGTGSYNYHWMPNVSALSSSTNLCAATYTISVTDGNGCVVNTTNTITEPAPLSYTLSQSNATCNGLSNGTSNIITSGGTAPYNFLWNTSPVQTSATATNLSAGIHSVIISDNEGCSLITSVTITEPLALAANGLVINNVTCNGAGDGYAIVGASGGTGMYDYFWNTTPAQNTQSISNLLPGNYSATVTDANNCVATSSLTITQPSPLTLSSTALPLSCNGSNNGQTIVIPTGGTSSYSYQWLPNGGTGPIATGLSPGTYSIAVTDANGCNANASATVTEPAPIVVVATGSTTICLGQNTAISASATGGNGGYSYSWSGGLNNGANQLVNPPLPVTYIVSVTDALGCTGNSASVDINVTSLTAANLAVTGATSICSGGNTSIFSTLSGNTGTVTIQWSNGLGTGSGPFVVTPANSTTYTVTVTDACATSITGLIPVIVNPNPIVNIAPQSSVGCGEVIMNFANNTANYSGYQYSWSFGDGTTSNLTSPTHSYSSTGIYNVSALVTSMYGCINSANTTCTVVVNPNTIAQFTPEALDGTTISPVYTFNNSSVNASSQLWYFGDGTTSTQINPKHTYASKGEYLVTLVTITSAGCRDSISIPVEIKPEFTLYIPNAFTPDGNGGNDYFAPKGQEISEFAMMIFDRWGALIYKTDDITKGWDGKANNGNKTAQIGVYVYKINVRDFEHRYHDFIGHVTLLTSE